MTKKTITNKEAMEVLDKGAKSVTDEDLHKVTNKADEIGKKFSSHGPLKRFIDDVKTMISLVKDYTNGNYRAIPWYTIAAIVTALLYVLNPVDLIPDFIPVLGYVDDALVVSVCLIAIERDLEKYKEWKAQTK